jgi:hypothetical protein
VNNNSDFNEESRLRSRIQIIIINLLNQTLMKNQNRSDRGRERERREEEEEEGE